MIKIYGASDDLVEVEGCDGADEFLTYQHDLMWHGDLIAADGIMRVFAILHDGCWAFAIGQVDESLSVAPWPVRITDHPDNPYSVLLEIDAPADTRLTDVWPEQGDDDG